MSWFLVPTHMNVLRWTQMTDAERDAFLDRGGTGVLSFAADGDDPPVSIPVSYGYSPEDTVFYFNLSESADSQKATHFDSTVSFVTYGETEAGWRSIVATGRLKELDDQPHESAVVQGMWSVRMPTVDIFDRPRAEITFRDFCLEPESLSGRKEVPQTR